MKISLFRQSTGLDLSRWRKLKWVYSVAPSSNYLVQLCSPRVNKNTQILTVSSQCLTISSALVSTLLSIDPLFRLQPFLFECVLTENGLAIMTTTTFKFPTAALHLLAIACIILVAVQMTDAAREPEDGVGGVLLSPEQVASVNTKAGLTLFQAAAFELLRLPCAVQSSVDGNCIANGADCWDLKHCCSGRCIAHLPLPPIPGYCI